MFCCKYNTVNQRGFRGMLNRVAKNLIAKQNFFLFCRIMMNGCPCKKSGIDKNYEFLFFWVIFWSLCRKSRLSLGTLNQSWGWCGRVAKSDLFWIIRWEHVFCWYCTAVKVTCFLRLLKWGDKGIGSFFLQPFKSLKTMKQTFIVRWIRRMGGCGVTCNQGGVIGRLGGVTCNRAANEPSVPSPPFKSLRITRFTRSTSSAWPESPITPN